MIWWLFGGWGKHLNCRKNFNLDIGLVLKEYYKKRLECLMDFFNTKQSLGHDLSSSSSTSPCSVAYANQVIGKLFNRVRSPSRLYCLWIMRNEDRLTCFDYHDSFFSLSRGFNQRSKWLCRRWSEDTFLPYKLLSSAFMVTYRWPAM